MPITVSTLNAIFYEAQTATNYVRPVAWIGRCPFCGEDSPEVRDSARAAQQDIDECPCRADQADQS